MSIDHESWSFDALGLSPDPDTLRAIDWDSLNAIEDEKAGTQDLVYDVSHLIGTLPENEKRRQLSDSLTSEWKEIAGDWE